MEGGRSYTQEQYSNVIDEIAAHLAFHALSPHPATHSLLRELQLANCDRICDPWTHYVRYITIIPYYQYPRSPLPSRHCSSSRVPPGPFISSLPATSWAIIIFGPSAVKDVPCATHNGGPTIHFGEGIYHLRGPDTGEVIGKETMLPHSMSTLQLRAVPHPLSQPVCSTWSVRLVGRASRQSTRLLQVGRFVRREVVGLVALLMRLKPRSTSPTSLPW